MLLYGQTRILSTDTSEFGTSLLDYIHSICISLAVLTAQRHKLSHYGKHGHRNLKETLRPRILAHAQLMLMAQLFATKAEANPEHSRDGVVSLMGFLSGRAFTSSSSTDCKRSNRRLVSPFWGLQQTTGLACANDLSIVFHSLAMFMRDVCMYVCM